MKKEKKIKKNLVKKQIFKKPMSKQKHRIKKVYRRKQTENVSVFKEIYIQKKKDDLLLFKSIQQKWRRFFVIKQKRTRAVYKINKYTPWWAKPKKEVLELKSYIKNLDIIYGISLGKETPKDYLGKYQYAYFINRESYWKGIKSKRTRQLRSWFNFNYYFSKFWQKKLPDYQKNFGTPNRSNAFYLQNPGWGQNKNRIKKKDIEKEKQAIEQEKEAAKKRLEDTEKKLLWRSRKKPWFKIKRTLWKKLILKRFLLSKYRITRLHQLKHFVFLARRLSGNKELNFYFYLESRVIPTCLRMGFFWQTYRGFNWLNWGFIYVNGYAAKHPSKRVNYNTIIRIIVPLKLWFIWQVSKNKVAMVLNITRIIFDKYEISLLYFAGLILNIPSKEKDIIIFFSKRKKHWLKTNTFNYLINSFY